MLMPPAPHLVRFSRLVCGSHLNRPQTTAPSGETVEDSAQGMYTGRCKMRITRVICVAGQRHSGSLSWHVHHGLEDSHCSTTRDRISSTS